MTKILGVDEARRGPVIGDMVICGALIEEIYEEDLKKLGVKDSKLLTPKQRERLFPKILEKIEKHKIIVIPPQEIDSMLNSQEFNLNRLEAIKTAMIINELKPDKAIVDCPSPNKEEYRNYLNIFLKHKPELILEHKAERYPIVAAASILAKVTGDRRLEDLKNSLGIEFGSLPYNEEILIKNKNKIEYKKIGDLVENGYHNIEVFSLDPKSLMIKPFKVTRFIDHPKTNIFNITLERGKNINLTENHPIFVLDNQLNIVPKQIKDLKKGEFICLAGSIPHRGNLNKINLYNYLINLSEKKSPILVYGNPVKEIFKKFGTKKIQDIYKKLNYSRTTVYSWKSNNIIPLHLIKEIIKGKRFNLDDGYLRSIKRDNIKLPINFKLNKEFLWFLGMYVAEGSLGKDKVIISSKDEKTFFRIKRLAKKYKINVYKEKCNIGLSSIVLTKLIKGMNLGRYAREKQIPNFLFSCKKDFIKAFLDGLYEGDGYIKNNYMEIEIYSKQLAKQIQLANLLLGNFTSYCKRGNRDGNIVHIMAKGTNSLSPDNIPFIIGPFLQDLRKAKNISLKIMSYKTGIDSSHILRIEKGKMKTIQKNTISKISRVLGNPIKIDNLLKADLCWLKVIDIKKLKEEEKVYDLEVKPNNKNIENFLDINGIILHNSGYMSDPKTQKFLEENHSKFDGIFRKTWTPYKNHINKQKGLNEF